MILDSLNNTYHYEYFLRDHLGSIRVRFKEGASNTAQIQEENHYYPFGMLISDISWKGEGDNDMLFSGKQLNNELFNGVNLSWYDFHARNYDPQLVMWFNVDPLAENYHNHTPYNYCFSDPVNFIDPTGMGPVTLDASPGQNVSGGSRRRDYGDMFDTPSFLDLWWANDRFDNSFSNTQNMVDDAFNNTPKGMNGHFEYNNGRLTSWVIRDIDPTDNGSDPVRSVMSAVGNLIKMTGGGSVYINTSYLGRLNAIAQFGGNSTGLLACNSCGGIVLSGWDPANNVDNFFPGKRNSDNVFDQGYEAAWNMYYKETWIKSAWDGYKGEEYNRPEGSSFPVKLRRTFWSFINMDKWQAGWNSGFTDSYYYGYVKGYNYGLEERIRQGYKINEDVKRNLVEPLVPKWYEFLGW